MTETEEILKDALKKLKNINSRLDVMDIQLSLANSKPLKQINPELAEENRRKLRKEVYAENMRVYKMACTDIPLIDVERMNYLDRQNFNRSHRDY